MPCCHVTTQVNLLSFFSPGFKIYHQDLKKFINFRLLAQTPDGASSRDPLGTSVLKTP